MDCQLYWPLGRLRQPREVQHAMTKHIGIALGFLFLVGASQADDSDDTLLELVRSNAFKGFLEQSSTTLPRSFHESGLAPSDKQTLIEQWARDSADCLADSLAAYALTTETPLSEMVNEDGSFSLSGDGASSDFHVALDACIERAWASVGPELPS